ncbi:hypothetical protein [Luteolibacter marinus]|uniref:hypothetical protein n=1 Tax=Luteolibacter marinus TaxID=2776705 RepID=UPI001867A265|nr:hypothetical protein [Luteolibacter marinus]
MKTKWKMIELVQASERVLRLGMGAIFALALPLHAKKGGNPGGEDPPPPPPAEPPIHYEIRWLTPADSPDDTRLWDVDPSGVAVGQVRPGGSAEDRYGVVSFPGRPLINLEELVRSGTHEGDVLPDGWKLNAVTKISNSLLVGGDLIPSPGSDYNCGCFAAQLVDDGISVSVAWFEIFPVPVGAVAVLLEDASESGDYFVAEVTRSGSPDEIHCWSPRTTPEVTEMVTLLNGAVWSLSVNNAGQICWSEDADQGQDSYIAEPGGGITVVGLGTRFESFYAKDISDNGTVVGGFVKRRFSGQHPGIWTPGAGWEELASPTYSGSVWMINDALQTFGQVDSRYFTYSPAGGFLWMDDLLGSSGEADDLDRWTATGGISTWYMNSHSISDANSTGYGWIAGFKMFEGVCRAFVMRPTPVAP